MIVEIKTQYAEVQGRLILELSDSRPIILKTYYRTPNYCIRLYVKDDIEYNTLVYATNNIAYHIAHETIQITVVRRFTPILDNKYDNIRRRLR